MMHSHTFFPLFFALQTTWMNQLKDAQDNYKLALKRSQEGGVDTQSVFEGIVPSSPQSLLPGSPISSVSDSPPQLKMASSTAPKDSTSTEDGSTDTLVQLASCAPGPSKLPPGPLIPDSIPSSMESSLASLTNLDPDPSFHPSPIPYIRRPALPLTPSTRRTRTRGSIRAGRTSLSPPASPARDRRLNTLKKLHEKAKSMDVMFV